METDRSSVSKVVGSVVADWADGVLAETLAVRKVGGEWKEGANAVAEENAATSSSSDRNEEGMLTVYTMSVSCGSLLFVDAENNC